MRCEVISFYRNFGAASSVAVVEERGGGEGGVKDFSVGLIKLRVYLHEIGTNSDRHEFVSVSIHFFFFLRLHEFRPV